VLKSDDQTPGGIGIERAGVDNGREEGPPWAAVDRDHAVPEVLTVDEAAALLRVNRKTIYEAIARRQLPGARRIGRVIRISRDAVLERRSGCLTERNRRDASSARSEEGAYREYVTDERRSDAKQIGDFATEGNPFGVLDWLRQGRVSRSGGGSP
jgi:excisionase family DNA binding protein